MSYLLDTNAAIALLTGKPLAVRDRYREVESAGAYLAVSSVVLFELWYGAAKRARPRENAERLRVFLSGRLDVLPFDDEDAVTSGKVRAALETAGTPIGAYDLLIAGQALRHRLTLVTANTSEFGRVPGLRLEDWTRGA
ncbi:MAG: type II toxin-antitoxin system VapC family toxin [Nocardioidaceae bacterium]